RPVRVFRRPFAHALAVDGRAHRGSGEPAHLRPRALVPFAPGRPARPRAGDPLRMNALIEARGLWKVFRGGDERPLEVLRGVDVDVHRGEVLAVVGASGAGHDTPMHRRTAPGRASRGAGR